KEKFVKLKEFCLLLLKKSNTKECFEQFQSFYQRLMRKGLRLLISQYFFRSEIERVKVRGILINLMKNAHALEGNQSFRNLKDLEDFNKIDVEFYLEEFSKVKLKDQYKNLSFEEVTKKEKEILHTWETLESEEKDFSDYFKDLISCINNE